VPYVQISPPIKNSPVKRSNRFTRAVLLPLLEDVRLIAVLPLLLLKELLQYPPVVQQEPEDPADFAFLRP
jgi:hypothetical protein